MCDDVFEIASKIPSLVQHYSDISTVQLLALLKRDHDPYCGSFFCDRLINVSEVTGIPNSLTCFVSFKKSI
jgi:hypothetical protein